MRVNYPHLRLPPTKALGGIAQDIGSMFTKKRGRCGEGCGEESDQSKKQKTIENSWKFDSESSFVLNEKVFHLTDDNSIATKVQSKGWANTLKIGPVLHKASGKHTISFRVLPTEEKTIDGLPMPFVVGAVPATVADDKDNFDTDGWGICTGNGGLVGMGENMSKKSGAIEEYNILTIQVNLCKHPVDCTVEFFLDGVSLGPGFNSDMEDENRSYMNVNVPMQFAITVPQVGTKCKIV